MAGTARDYAEQIKLILEADSVLLGTLPGAAPLPGEQDARSYTGLAKGGIYTHVPKPWDSKDNRGVTPIAFSAASGAIKPTITVTNEPTSHHFQFRRIRKAVVASVVVWMYAGSHDSGKSAMEEIRRRVDQLLDDQYFTTDQGPVGFIEWDFHFGAIDNHRQFPGSRVSYTRFAITTLRGEET